MFCRFVPFTFMVVIVGILGCQSTLREQLLQPEPELINFALAANGATVESPDRNSSHLPEEVIDGDTSSDTWDEGSGWAGSLDHLRTNEIHRRSYIQINLAGKKLIKRIAVYTIDSEKYPARKYGLKNYRVEYWHGTGWNLIPTGRRADKLYTVRNNKSGRIVHDIHGHLITDKIRLVPIYSNDTKRVFDHTVYRGRALYNVEGAARVMEIQVLGYPSSTGKAAEKIKEILTPPSKLPVSDEVAIRTVLKNYERGYEQEDLTTVMSCFSENYFSNGRTYTDIQKKAADFFQQNDHIDLTMSNIKISMNVIDGTAIANALLTLQYTPTGTSKPKQVSWKFSLSLAREDETWKIISAD